MQSTPYTVPPLAKGREFVAAAGEPLDLRNVWDANLDEEMDRMMKAIERYPYIAMVWLGVGGVICRIPSFLGCAILELKKAQTSLNIIFFEAM